MSGEFLSFEEGSGYANSTEAENVTLSCLAESIQVSVTTQLPYSSTLTMAVRGVLAFFYIIFLFVGTFLNSLVIVLVAKHKKLHTLSFAIALQVVVLDLLLSLTFMVNLVSAIANRWLFGEHFCAFVGFVVLIMASMRTFLMFIFVIDHFLSVFLPFSYTKHKVKVVVSLSVLCWVLSFAIQAAMLPGLLGCYHFSTLSWSCGFSSQCRGNCSIFIAVYLYLILIPITVLPIVLYIALFCKAKKARKNDAAFSDSRSQKKEWKATITFFLLFLSVLVTVLPTNLISSLIFNISREISAASYVILSLNVIVVRLLVITDPIVIMRNQDVREILAKRKTNIKFVHRTINSHIAIHFLQTNFYECG